MAFAARALAQSHPFTNLAKGILDASMEVERKAQPGEFSIWAASALTKGYCVRRVEEDDEGMVMAAADESALPAPEAVEEASLRIVTALQSPDSTLDFLLGDEERTLEVLDRVIGSEVGNRLDNAPNSLNARGRAELEDYLTYWVIKGYALRAAEMATGALTKA